MVLILDGISEPGAYMWRKTCIFPRTKIWTAVDLNKCLYHVKLAISIYTCAPISEIPSNISTMSLTLNFLIKPNYPDDVLKRKNCKENGEVLPYFSVRHTVCPRSLDLFYIVSYNIKWVKTSWTYSTCNSGTFSNPLKPIHTFLNKNIFLLSLNFPSSTAICRN